MTNKVYQIITDQIIELLEEGTIPWNQPWTNIPKSLSSGKTYRGINYFVLNAVASRQGYKSEYWVTYKNAVKLGGNVRQGEKSTRVVFWKWLEEKDKAGEPTGNRIPLLRYFRLFNVEQCEGLEYPEPITTPFDDIETAEQIAANMPNKPGITHAGGRAFYSPGKDSVTLPDKPYFKSEAGYYSTLFHELVHSTGHSSRLSRKGIMKLSGFRSESYSREELIAEMGAAMLCGIVGIENETINNQAAYIKSWLAVLKDDPKMVIQAAGKAQRAADYIQGITYN